MDMNSAFDREARQHCPNARVVYDLFHVIAKYGRKVIDRVRVAPGLAARDGLCPTNPDPGTDALRQEAA